MESTKNIKHKERNSILHVWAKDLTVSLLEKMTAGRLELILPDGESLVFGDPDSDLQAGVRVFDNEFFVRCLLYGDIGLAESYMDGLCEFSSIKNVISWFLLNQKNSPVLNESDTLSRMINLLGLINRLGHAGRKNSRSNSKRNIADHYDLGNEFFKLFLDPSMTYSSALFASEEMTLEQAQKNKFDRIARQLKIEPGDSVLEVGCGWGAFSCYIGKKYRCSVTALTISEEQFAFARDLIRSEKLEGQIDLRLEDYREHKGAYDKIVSIEMIEAVGDQYIDTFISKLDSLLKPDGLLVMQMITSADCRYETLKRNVDFIQKHIFPGSLLPSLFRINQAMCKSGDLLLVDLFDMTHSYDMTLRRWQESFQKNISLIRQQGFDERFIRKWLYYFEYCQAAFAMRNVSVVQATYSRPNNLKLSGGVRGW